jgi:single-strand DNA-binding protein
MKDGEALFLSCNVWREVAENVAESLTRGSRVVAQGRLKQRSFETKEGEKRTVVELEVDEIGPSLRYATATVSKAARSGATSGGGARSGTDAGGVRAGSSPDSWAAPVGGDREDPPSEAPSPQRSPSGGREPLNSSPHRALPCKPQGPLPRQGGCVRMHRVAARTRGGPERPRCWACATG